MHLLRPHGTTVGFNLSEAGPARAHATGLTVLRGDVTRIPLASASFDVATSFDVMQCRRGRVAAVREMARIVRPGGVVVLTLAALDVFAAITRKCGRSSPLHAGNCASASVESAGLRPERVSFLFASLFPLMASIRLIQRVTRRFGRTRADTDISVPVEPINLLLTTLVSAEAALIRHVPMPMGVRCWLLRGRRRAHAACAIDRSYCRNQTTSEVPALQLQIASVLVQEIVGGQ